MQNQQRPVWYEGMTLDPHHFQQWDRFHHASIHSRLRALAPLGWGLTALEIDRETLANGQFRLSVCSGVMRDGIVFDMPHTEPLPSGRPVEKYFPPTEENMGVFLSVPSELASGRNCYLDGSTPDRQLQFLREYVSIVDNNTGSDERQISVARSNFSLLFGTEPREEFVTIEIARIVRGPDGKFALSQAFIPTCLSIGASENLTRMLRKLLELIIAKANFLGERRSQQQSGQIEFTTADIKTFWLLNTLNTFIPLLNYHSVKQYCHPEQLFLILLSLAGQLTTFSSDIDVRARDLPLYDHVESSAAFLELDSLIQKLLETAIATNSSVIPLEMKSEGIWGGRIADPQLMRRAQFFLTASGEIPERKVIDDLPRNIRIASPEGISSLLTMMVPGLRIEHSPRPPVGLPSRPGLQYFRLEKSGPFWDAINRSSAIAIFIPGEFKSLKLSLVAVMEPA